MIPAIFFTSDHHFGHKNIIRFCDRPFANVTEMDEELVQRWNALVGHDDTVYHLGDFTLGGRQAARRYLSRLRGVINFLVTPWHHDKRWLPKDDGLWSASAEVVFLPPLVVVQHDPPITLCHYPMAGWERSHYGAWHLHGHSHGRFPSVPRRLDVGVDAWDFYPVPLEEIERRLR